MSSGLFEAYVRPRLDGAERWDEMVDQTLGVRDAWQSVGEALTPLDPSGLSAQARAVSDLLAAEGVTYRPYGRDNDQPWQVDPVPMLVDETEWARIEPGLIQRTELLDLILTDLYGPRRLITERLLPPEIVYGHSGFVRAVDQLRLRSARQLFMSAADLVRGPDGQWQVVADRTQAPSGTGYTMAGRRAVSRTLPALYRDAPIRRISPFFEAMRDSLQDLAPAASDVPRVVLLTSGAASETAFDQAYLASLLGVPLVEGSDLLVEDGRVWQRSIGRLAPVDVILRRVDAWFCDPLELRPDSQLGVPGLIEAARLGAVSVVNSLGSGVLENPALYPYLPKLSEALLDEELAIDSVPTWWCGDPVAMRHVLANLPSLITKPIARDVIANSRLGWELSGAELDELAARIQHEPHNWVAQAAIEASVAPAVTSHGLEPLPINLRCFAVASGNTYRVMAGGMSRVSPNPSARIVLPRQGAAVKDIWVLSSAPTGPIGEDAARLRHGRVAAAVSPRVAETLFWLGRYAERAEDVSRLIAVADNLARDEHAGRDANVIRAGSIMLSSVFQVCAPWPPLADGAAPTADALFSLVSDPSRVGSLAHDLRRVRELANISRDQLSIDTWIALRDLDDVVASMSHPVRIGADLGQAMTRVRAALMAFAGLAAESMVRDSGWHFLDAGRRIERSLQLSRLLEACLVPAPARGVAGLVQEAALTAAESIITHRRRYPAGSGADTVLELLLIDRGNPRSLTFQLDLLGRDLRHIPEPVADHNPSAEQLTALIARVDGLDPESLGLVTAGVGEEGRRLALEDELLRLVTDLHVIADSLQHTHFPHQGALRPLAQPVPFDAVM
ncbi:MAG TPA: circularly permuted type 2 ATP-grasp protein [Jatrophihabitans sp.]|jgi:uncharacterized circularly permuted ATP-grasp superfamily protein/uncharacterized alpha-E superfamily protein